MKTAMSYQVTPADEVRGHTILWDVTVRMAVAHAVSDKVEAAYRRSDLVRKRRLSDAWGKFSGTKLTTGCLVSMRRRV